MATRDPLLQRFPEVARLLGGLHQDADLAWADLADCARAFLRGPSGAGTDARALADQLRRAAALDGADIRALWRKSGAEILPRRSADARALLRSAADAIDIGA
jgi:hypothetical protein